jgi:hypothetical protein
LRCLGKSSDSQCLGVPYAYIQDPGTSFGGGTEGFSLSKLDFKGWMRSPIWEESHIKNSACRAHLKKSPLTGDSALVQPVILEEARSFLGKILTELFLSPNGGRERAMELFSVARFELSGIGIEQWATALQSKVEQIILPTGEPGFNCRDSIASE